MDHRWLVVEFVLTDGGRKAMTMAPCVVTVEDYDGVLSLVSRVQIPLMLAYCMTVHRARELTFEKVVFKTDGIFANGQLYIAMSRVQASRDMCLVADIKKGVTLQSQAVIHGV